MNVQQNSKEANGPGALDRPVRLLSDQEIISIRDDSLPGQGEQFDCIGFARKIEEAALWKVIDNITASIHCGGGQ